MLNSVIWYLLRSKPMKKWGFLSVICGSFGSVALKIERFPERSNGLLRDFNCFSFNVSLLLWIWTVKTEGLAVTCQGCRFAGLGDGIWHELRACGRYCHPETCINCMPPMVKMTRVLHCQFNYLRKRGVPITLCICNRQVPWTRVHVVLWVAILKMT